MKATQLIQGISLLDWFGFNLQLKILFLLPDTVRPFNVASTVQDKNGEFHSIGPSTLSRGTHF
jgi:hypothetical protein